VRVSAVPLEPSDKCWESERLISLLRGKLSPATGAEKNGGGDSDERVRGRESGRPVEEGAELNASEKVDNLLTRREERLRSVRGWSEDPVEDSSWANESCPAVWGLRRSSRAAASWSLNSISVPVDWKDVRWLVCGDRGLSDRCGPPEVVEAARLDADCRECGANGLRLMGRSSVQGSDIDCRYGEVEGGPVEGEGRASEKDSPRVAAVTMLPVAQSCRTT